MKNAIQDLGISIISGVFIPAFLLSLFVLGETDPQIESTDSDILIINHTPICVQTGNGRQLMDMEEYVLGVVLAEMPANFEMEALKAQAVAARTFAEKALISGGKHGDRSVCTKSGCCQGYITKESYLIKGHTNESLNIIQKAVSDTSGEVIFFENDLIDAAYFSCSGGFTEDAVEVWGSARPYLVSKESPGEQGIELSEDKQFLKTDLEKILNISLPIDTERWFSCWEYTRGGGVASVIIGNKQFDGKYLRKALNLRSTLFSVTLAGENIIFHTDGYGHRVGMSQYGAEAMAVRGKKYDEIIQYYYSGTTLRNIYS